MIKENSDKHDRFYAIQKYNDRSELWAQFLNAVDQYNKKYPLNQNSPIILISKGIPFEAYAIENVIYCSVNGDSTIWQIKSTAEFLDFITSFGNKQKLCNLQPEKRLKKVLYNKRPMPAVTFIGLHKNNLLIKLFYSFRKLANLSIKKLSDIPYDLLSLLFSEKYSIRFEFFKYNIFKYLKKIDGIMFCFCKGDYHILTYDMIVENVYKSENIYPISIEDTKTLITTINKLLPNSCSVVPFVRDRVGIFYVYPSQVYSGISEKAYIYYDSMTQQFVAYNLGQNALLEPRKNTPNNNYVPLEVLNILEVISGGNTEIIDMLSMLVASALSPSLKLNRIIIFQRFPKRICELIVLLLERILPNLIIKASLKDLGKSSNLPFLTECQLNGIRLNISQGNDYPTRENQNLRKMISGSSKIKFSTEISKLEYISTLNLIHFSDNLPNSNNPTFMDSNCRFIQSSVSNDITVPQYSKLKFKLQHCEASEYNWMRTAFALNGIKRLFDLHNENPPKSSLDLNDIYCNIVKEFIFSCCVFEENGFVTKEEFKRAGESFWKTHNMGYSKFEKTKFDQVFKQLFSVKSNGETVPKIKVTDESLIKNLTPPFVIEETNKRIIKGNRRPWIYTGIALSQNRVTSLSSEKSETHTCNISEYLASMNSLLPI